MAAVWTGPEQANFKKVLAEFEKRTGAKVTFVPAQDPIINFLGTKIAGGSPPDVAMLPQPGAIKQAVDKGWAKPLGADAQAQLAKNYSQGWQDLGTVDGKQYGVYFKAANKSLIWYNAKVFENAGATEPKTWADFLKTAQTISDSGVTPVSVGGADGWTLTDWFENVYLSQAGPEKYDQLAQHKIKWTDPSVKEALTTLAQLWGKQDLHRGRRERRAPDRVPRLGHPDVHRRRPAEGRHGLRGRLRGGQHRATTKAKVGTDAKVFPFPTVGAHRAGGHRRRRGGGAEGHQGRAGADDLPGLAGRGADPGEARRLLSPNKNVDVSAYPNDVSGPSPRR